MKNRTIAICMIIFISLVLIMPVNLLAQEEQISTELSEQTDEETKAEQIAFEARQSEEMPSEESEQTGDKIKPEQTDIESEEPTQTLSETSEQGGEETAPTNQTDAGVDENKEPDIEKSSTETILNGEVEEHKASPMATPLKKVPAAETDWFKLKKKIEAAATNGTPETIKIDTDVTADLTKDAGRTIEIKEKQNIVLQGNGTVKGIGLFSFKVFKGGSLTIDGPSLSNAQIIAEGSLNLNSGKVSDTKLEGPTIFVHSGEFTMNGGEISGNEAIESKTPKPSELISDGNFYQYSPITIYSGTFNLTGGTISGNKAFLKGGAIGAWGTDASKAKLVINGGEIKGNVAEHSFKFAWGGSLYMQNCEFEMLGGTVSNSTAEYGGGIAAIKSNMIFNGGNIIENTNGGYKGKGGGILASETDITIQNANISKNVANGNGGGIYASSLGEEKKFLRIEGGKFEGNIAARNNESSSGGAICVFGYKYKINGGTFKDNSAETSGGAIYFTFKSSGEINAGVFKKNQAKGFYGGGAIFNDGKCKLLIKRALIKENTIAEAFMIGAGDHPVSRQGGGIWNCPFGNTVINITNGLALFDNSAPDFPKYSAYKGAGDDFINITKYTFGEQDGSSHVKLASRMLGGGYRLWYQDGSFEGIHSNWAEDDQTPRYDPSTPGKPLPYNIDIVEMKGAQLAYKSVPSEESKALAEQVATTIFSGNKAFMVGISGGAISNNGELEFGEDNPYKLKIVKSWAGDDINKRPKEILLRMFIGEHYVQDVKLTAEKNWTAIIEDFPDPDTLVDNQTGETLPIHFEEDHHKEYVLSMLSTAKDEEGRTYTISLENSIPKTRVEGSKTWNDADNQDGKRPTQIVINLLKNGEKIDSKIVKKEDAWKWTFENLAKYENGELINYGISEEAVPEYTSEVKGYDVENSYVPEKTSIRVKKIWKDDNNQDGKRPVSVRVKLLADGKEVSGKTLVLKTENEWIGEFSDLNVYKAGRKIDYTIEEIDVQPNYKSIITGTAKDGFVLTNIRKPKDRKVPNTGENEKFSIQTSLILLAAACGTLLRLRKRREH